MLILWIYFLGSTVIFTANNSTAKFVFEFSDSFFNYYPYFARESRDGQVHPRAELAKFLSQFRQNSPPIGLVVDKLITEPSWEDRDIKPKKYDEGTNIERWKKDQFQYLFKRVHQRLSSYVNDPTLDLSKIEIGFSDIIPESWFRNKKDRQRIIKLPKEAILWVKAERDIVDFRNERLALINTFIILMVLGAFGSLIFLTRDYIHAEESVGLASYIFRPVLGMFLAVSMFVIDIAAHTLISSSDIFKIRHETLYLLAFAAGLLSEQAYLLVNKKANEALNGVKSKKKDNHAENNIVVREATNNNELPKDKEEDEDEKHNP